MPRKRKHVEDFLRECPICREFKNGYSKITAEKLKLLHRVEKHGEIEQLEEEEEEE